MRRKRYKSCFIKIRENDYNLNIQDSVDTSPPPEQFDKSNLGGVPVSEVENDYIQETSWNGWSCPCAGDDDYYDFKPGDRDKETNQRPY